MKKLFIITFIFFNTSGYTQGITAGIKLGGIGYHPKPTGSEQFYKYALNKKRNLALFRSITFCFSYDFNEFIGIKAVQTLLLKDCANKFAGVSHLGINIHDRLINWTNEQYRGSFSFGPLFYYRKNWNQIEGYQTDPAFIQLSQNKIWERKFVWYGGQIQLDYFTNNRDAVSINILPGYPYIYAISAGYSRRIP